VRPPLTRLVPAAFVYASGFLAACAADGTGASPTPLERPAAAAPAPPTTAAADAPEAAAPAPSAIPAPAVYASTSVSPAAPARLWSKARFAWIQPEPRPSRGWLGYLGLGGSVALRGGSAETAKAGSGAGSGCDTWYAVEPRGYVCTGDTATLDPKDPVVRELALDAPKTDSPWPYEYGESLGAPRYAAVPSAADEHKDEWYLDAHLALVTKARAGEPADKSIEGVDVSPASPGRWGAPPAPDALAALGPLVREPRKWIATGSTVAYTRSFDLDGRTFLVTHDHAFVPKDRVRPYPRSSFHGVVLDAAHALPIAFFRETDRPQYRREAGGFERTGAAFPRLGSVGLTGLEAKDGEHTYLETREPGVWVLKDDACVARAAKDPPAMVQAMTSGRRTWLDVSVLGGTLVAYEGDRPVFATLISPGRGGIPERGRDPLQTASTPTGTFRVDGKFVTATMVSSTNDLLVHTEVEYVQNFHGPHALHAAYWHDAWGEKKSGGCINLAPLDAQRLFAWTEPSLPEGWYGQRSVAELGPATVVLVRR
jgi:L,D-transpeptidase catalytic domain